MAEDKFRVRPEVRNNSKNKLLYNPNDRKKTQLGNFSRWKNSLNNQDEELEEDELNQEDKEQENELENEEEIQDQENNEEEREEQASKKNGQAIIEQGKKQIKTAAEAEIKAKAKKVAISFIAKNPWVLAIVGGIIVLFLIILSMSGLVGVPENLADYELSGGEKYWWPIGGVKEENGKAIGTPSTVYISSPYGIRNDPHNPSKRKLHTGIDIANSGENFIIAAKSGKVLTAKTGCIEGNKSCGGGYGNHVVIKHSDGIETTYAHLKENSIRVLVGQEVSQGEIIGNMGSTGSSTGRHLHFGVKVNGDFEDPLNYVSADDPRPEVVISAGGTTSLLRTALTKTEFTSYLNNYSKKLSGSKKTDFDTNFLSNAELIYDTSMKKNINPEIVLMWASIESGFKKCGGYYNFWGIGIANGQECDDGPHYSSMEEGLNGFVGVIAGYQDPKSSSYKQIMNRYKERKDAGCRAGGYGTPDTLEGILSIYSWFGTYLANPGGPGSGGCYYIKAYIDKDFLPDTYNQAYLDKRCNPNYKCSSPNGGGDCVKTTICEQSDYTIYGARSRMSAREAIFKS
ncbi:MAG: M23 family metallopeptidase [Clostridia bacterium]